MEVLRKMSNQKSPGLDNVTKMHDKLLNNLTQCIEEGKVPYCMTKKRIVLIQKDKSKANAASSYRPVNCIPLV